MENTAEELNYIKALGRLQHDVERIIKASSAMDKTAIVSMLKMALAQSDMDCSLILKTKLKELEEKRNESERNSSLSR